IRGFKRALTAAIMAWRNNAESRARIAMSQDLSVQEKTDIHKRYVNQHAQLAKTVEQERQRVVHEETAIRTKAATLRAALEREERNADAHAPEQVRQIRDSYKVQAERITAELAKLKVTLTGEIRNADARMSQFHPSLAKLNYERG